MFGENARLANMLTASYRINHAPETWLKKWAPKNDQTMYKGGKTMSTVRHYPLRTLNKPLKENSKKLNRIAAERRGVSRVTASPARKLLVSQTKIQRMLRRNGYEDLRSARKGDDK